MIKQSIFLTAALSLSLGFGASMAQSPAPDNSKANADSDNSTNNLSTAGGQRNDSNDLAITQKIRRSVIADKHLSTYAHNVKIVAVNGNVTLNGVVRNDHERSVIAAKAEAVVGEGKVVNSLSVAPSKSRRSP